MDVKALSFLGIKGKIGLIIILFVVFIGITAPVISPYDPTSLFEPFEPPSSTHLLGTDDVGHDVLTILIYGARVSILVGFATATISTFIGLLTALIAGCYEGLDPIISRILDFFLVIPRIPFIVIISAFLTPNIFIVILVLSFFGWAKTARVIKPLVKQVYSREYVKRLKCIGAGNWYIILRHILPATFPLAVAQFVLEGGHAILAEASIGFFGLEDPSTLSWGMEINHALQKSIIFLTNIWTWVLGPPILMLTITLLSTTFISIDLETRINPRLKVRSW
ncbi:ABC transporter permease [Candidatus Geothermarchaeota archaeon]|nr:MAG: ABC transporter permease [Candidatus Geothermarchaeota archaeon]HEW93917.1 ABC transporter permease [Thermoprotei archaeon]